MKRLLKIRKVAIFVVTGITMSGKKDTIRILCQLWGISLEANELIGRVDRTGVWEGLRDIRSQV